MPDNGFRFFKRAKTQVVISVCIYKIVKGKSVADTFFHHD